MAKKKKPSRPFKLGDLVQIDYYPQMRGRIIELRGPLGPGGAQIYRVRIPWKPKATLVEVREDQLNLLSPADETPQEAPQKP